MLLYNEHFDFSESSSVDEIKFSKDREFKYVGVTFSQDNREEFELENRLIAAKKGLWSLSKLLSSEELSKTVKLRIYHTITQREILYGTEHLAMSKT